MRRSMLFLPGNSPKMIFYGIFMNADSLILDLEDAVSPDEKDAARILVRNALSSLDFGSRELIVRINSLTTTYWQDDLEAIVPLAPYAVMPTKVSDGDYIRQLDEKIGDIEARSGISAGSTRIIPLLETASGIEHAYDIALASERMDALYLGAEDLCADLRCERSKGGAEILYARGRLVCAARAAGIDAYDTPFTDVEDIEGLEADACFAKSLGFSGKAVISPRHIETVNSVFSPTEKEIKYARDVFEAIDEAKRLGKGAISLGGKMIDAPIVKRAQYVLECAQALGTDGGDIL